MLFVTGHDVDPSSHSTAPTRIGSRGTIRPQLLGHALSVILVHLNAWAIWALERFKPMKYRHKIHTRNG